MRFGTVAIIGRSNVGKTTLLNAALGEELAVVSPVPQTTRDILLGIAHRPDAQIAFVDTPGLHRPRSELGRRMNLSALEAARSTDVVVLMTDVSTLRRRRRATEPADQEQSLIHPEDRELLAELGPKRNLILVINKVDQLRHKLDLLRLIEAFGKLADFDAAIPASVLDAADVERILEQIERLLPLGPAAYDEETLTDKPQSFFVREYVREQVLRCAGREVPHAVAVQIDAISDHLQLVLIKATLHVEKVGQRKILVGRGGEMIKRIGTQARERIEQFLDRKVYLELFVRVSPRWKNMPRQLAELGYLAPEGAQALRLPERFDLGKRRSRRNRA
jgi:GTP-binding protein Era